MDGYLYILQSLKNETYYIGSTTNPALRLKYHNRGYVKATKYKRPYKLVFQQKFSDIQTAQMVERRLKKWKRKDFIEKIINDDKIEYTGP